MDFYNSIIEVHEEMVGGYTSKRFKHHVFGFNWDRDLAEAVTSINPKRRDKRVASYLDPFEIDRVQDRAHAGKDFSLRMGVEKTGAGNFGERGDFCMLGASYSKKVLTLHYRSLELFGGMVYDQAIIMAIQDGFDNLFDGGLPIKKVVNLCASCHSFALKGNSNEKLFQKLQKVYEAFR